MPGGSGRPIKPNRVSSQLDASLRLALSGGEVVALGKARGAAGSSQVVGDRAVVVAGHLCGCARTASEPVVAGQPNAQAGERAQTGDRAVDHGQSEWLG